MPAALRTGAGRTPDGAAWLAHLPALVARARDRWSLDVGSPFPSGSASWCAPVRRGREHLVLKISFPHEEARHEAAVLRAWHGHGAVGLVDADAGDWALLLERVRPGTPMRAVRTPVAHRLAAAADVLRDLHAVAAPDQAPDQAPSQTTGSAPDVVPDLGAVTVGLAGLLRDRADRAASGGIRMDPALLRAALAVLDAGRAGSSARPVLLHGDLNPGNLLLLDAGAGVRRWCAIDPKALRGEAAYDAGPLLEQVGAPWRTPDPVRTLRARLDLVSDRAGLDPTAVAAWAAARAVEAAFWSWQHGLRAPALRRRLAAAGDWLRVRDAVTG